MSEKPKKLPAVVQRSLRAAAKEAAERKAAEPAPQKPIAHPPAAKPPMQVTPAVDPPKKTPFVRKPAPPFTSYQPLKVLCGHVIQFGIWEPEKAKDRYRAERKKKAMSRKCPECRKQAHEELMVVHKANREARQAERAKYKGPVQTIGWRTRASKRLERLPDGSTFSMKYDGATCQWTGSLTMFGSDPLICTHFEGQHTAVMKLLAQLDGKYREWLTTNGLPTGVEELDPVGKYIEYPKEQLDEKPPD